MLCAKCGAENPGGKRFCGDCGATLANRCEQCGAENPPEKKFAAIAAVCSARRWPPQSHLPRHTGRLPISVSHRSSQTLQRRSTATQERHCIVRAGEIAVPPDAEVIDVAGKTVLPGFIDGHAHLEDFHGDLYLHLGITSCATIDVFQDGPWTLAQKHGTALGKIRGPRIWTSGQAIGGVRTETDAPDSRAVRGNISVETPEQARAAIRRKKELGYDLIKLNEFISFDLVHAAADEAHKVGSTGDRPQLGRDRVGQGRRRQHRAHLVGGLQNILP